MSSKSRKESLAIIWSALEAFREDLIPAGDECYDEQWDDICTAMADITEDLAKLEGCDPSQLVP